MSNKLVVRLPPAIPPDLFNQLSSLLGKLSPHESHESSPNWAEKWTGWGTVALAAIAAVTAGVAWVQFTQERDARKRERIEQEKARQHEQDLLEEARTARYAEAFTAATQRWNDRPMRDARKKIRVYHDTIGAVALRDEMEAKRVSRDPEYFEMLMVMDYFEDLAILLSNKSIAFGMVDSSLGTTICQYWTIWQPFIALMRGTLGDQHYDPAYYAAWQRLAESIAAEHPGYLPWQF